MSTLLPVWSPRMRMLILPVHCADEIGRYELNLPPPVFVRVDPIIHVEKYTPGTSPFDRKFYPDSYGLRCVQHEEHTPACAPPKNPCGRLYRIFVVVSTVRTAPPIAFMPSVVLYEKRLYVFTGTIAIVTPPMLIFPLSTVTESVCNVELITPEHSPLLTMIANLHVPEIVGFVSKVNSSLLEL